MKAIFIDFDGTLANSKKQISEANIYALTHAKAAGYEIVLATGRPYDYIGDVIKQYGNICRYAVTSAGAIVYDFKKHKPITINPIPKTAVAELFKLQNPELIWLLHCTDGLFTSAPISDQKGTNKLITTTLDHFVSTRTVCEMTIVGENLDMIKNLQCDVRKIPGIYISNQSKVLSDPSFQLKHAPYFDIIANEVSKGSGIKTIRDLLGIKKSDCIAIGDDLNDLSMFAECGYSVAMGNSIPTVKKIADHVTDDNNSDGVAKFLIDYLKIK